MLTDAEIAAMTQEERVDLAQRLAAANTDLVGEPESSTRRRRWIVNALVVICLGLIPWTVFLGLTLPRHYLAHHWVGAWVGYDVVLICGLAVTAWGGWRRRQIVIVSALITGTLLVTDAWFDLLTDATTHDLVISIITAVLGELPLAALLFFAAFRLIRITTHTARVLAGDRDFPPLRKVPLFAIDPLDAR